MQLVAASRMRKAQEYTKSSAPYTEAARDLLSALASHYSVKDHPLFEKREVGTRLLIVIASDSGLAGAFNSNLNRLYAQELIKDDKNGIKNTTITVGRKASQFATRLKDTEILGAYQGLPDRPNGSELRTILDTAMNHFTSGKVDAVDVIYTQYVNAVRQEATVVRVLPAGDDLNVDEAAPHRDVLYEPSVDEVIDGVTYRLIGAQLFQALLDSKASEYSMRMMAMKNATDNASDLIDDLTLEMNKARQAAITQELSEISGGVEALND
jgi:F-type H+-transporting ATPase subunit gamma